VAAQPPDDVNFNLTMHAFIQKGDDSMNFSFRLWLKELEDTLWRMINGVYRFIFMRLPELVVRMLLETIGPVAVQLIRVIVVLSLWLAVVSVPAIVAASLGGWGGLVAGAWVALALTGSVWGRAYLVRKSRWAMDAGRPGRDGLPLARVAGV
jgi:hypothetical protein